MPHQVFILSPANCSGKRAGILMRPQAEFDLAVRLRTNENLGATPLNTFIAHITDIIKTKSREL